MARIARPLAGALLTLSVLAAAAAGTRTVAGGKPRPFVHERHEAVQCTACHGTGERHGTLLVKTPLQCAACHHDAAQPRACAVCHADALPEPRSVQRVFASGIFVEPRLRRLPFAHARHAELPCRDCHTTPVTLAPERPCTSCHEAHHRPAAECAACHQPPGPPVHDAGVHLSCAGAGCHAAAVAPALSQSRTVCLACHPRQQAHEPGGACASCHLLVTEGAP
jgi:hypothetical protein